MPRIASVNKQLAEHFARLRQQSGYSQLALSRILDIDPSAISHWESGKTRPTYELAAKLTQAYGIGIEELLPVEIILQGGSK